MTTQEETIYIFASRYTHTRKTGGTLAVCKELARVWDDMSDESKKRIEKEAFNEATANRDDWAEFFGWEDKQ